MVAATIGRVKVNLGSKLDALIEDLRRIRVLAGEMQAKRQSEGVPLACEQVPHPGLWPIPVHEAYPETARKMGVSL